MKIEDSIDVMRRQIGKAGIWNVDWFAGVDGKLDGWRWVVK
jgi:hypothetical protein